MLTCCLKGVALTGWLCPERSVQGTARPHLCSWCRRAVQGLSVWPCQLGCRACFRELIALREQETPAFLAEIHFSWLSSF